MTHTTDTRLARLEIAARRQQRPLAEWSDAELAAEAAQTAPEIRAWLATLSDDELREIADDTPAGRALIATAPGGAS
ncbi:MAG: hypothetical protein ACYC1W_09670 [Gemmatimonadaceae bacterium]